MKKEQIIEKLNQRKFEEDCIKHKLCPKCGGDINRLFNPIWWHWVYKCLKCNKVY